MYIGQRVPASRSLICAAIVSQGVVAILEAVSRDSALASAVAVKEEVQNHTSSLRSGKVRNGFVGSTDIPRPSQQRRHRDTEPAVAAPEPAKGVASPKRQLSGGLAGAPECSAEAKAPVANGGKQSRLKNGQFASRGGEANPPVLALVPYTKQPNQYTKHLYRGEAKPHKASGKQPKHGASAAPKAATVPGPSAAPAQPGQHPVPYTKQPNQYTKHLWRGEKQPSPKPIAATGRVTTAAASAGYELQYHPLKLLLLLTSDA